MEPQFRINHLAILVLVALSMGLSALWYGIFADQWMGYVGLTAEQANNAGPWPFVVAILGGFATYYGMAFLFIQLKVRDVARGALTAALFWFCFQAFTIFTIYLFALKPAGLAFIDAGHEFVNFVVGGAVLGLWKRQAKA